MPKQLWQCSYCDFTSFKKKEVEAHEEEHIICVNGMHIKSDGKETPAILRVTKEEDRVLIKITTGTEESKWQTTRTISLPLDEFHKITEIKLDSNSLDMEDIRKE